MNNTRKGDFTPHLGQKCEFLTALIVGALVGGITTEGMTGDNFGQGALGGAITGGLGAGASGLLGGFGDAGSAIADSAGSATGDALAFASDAGLGSAGLADAATSAAAGGGSLGFGGGPSGFAGLADSGTSAAAGGANLGFGGGATDTTTLAADSLIPGGGSVMPAADTTAAADTTLSGFTSPTDFSLGAGLNSSSSFLGDTSGLGLSAPSSGSFGDYSLASGTSSGSSLGEPIAGAATDSSGPFGLSKDTLAWLNSPAAKLGLSGLNMMRGQSASNQAAGQLRQVGAPQRALGNQLVSEYNAGTLHPAAEAGIDMQEQQALAQAKQYFANAGMANSTQAQAAYAQIAANAEAQRQTAREQLLQVGLQQLGLTDQSTILAIQTQLQGNQAAQKNQSDFMANIGALMAGQQTPTKPTSYTLTPSA